MAARFKGGLFLCKAKSKQRFATYRAEKVSFSFPASCRAKDRSLNDDGVTLRP